MSFAQFFKKRSITFVLFIFVIENNLISQGNTCTGATSVTTNGACTSAATITDATINGNPTVCGGTVSREAWYIFTASGTTATIVATANNRNVAIELLSACGGTVVGCDNTTTGGGPDTETLTVTGLTNGTNYIVRIVNVGSNNDMVLTSLCITGPVSAPSNDDPTGATPITPAASCSYTTFTTAGATATSCGTIPAPGCASYSGNDVWFSIVVPASGGFILDSQTGVITDGGMAVYSGSPCGTMSLLNCDDDSSPNGAMPSLTVAATAGSTVYVRFWEYGNDNNGTFGICATTYTPPTAPSNDNPTGANPITPAASCSYTTFTTVGATATSCGTIPAPGCASYSGNDVWFSVVVPASGGFILDSQTGVITDGGMAVYSGSPCGTMSLLYCDDDSSPNGAMPSLTVAATAGSTVFVRFWEYGNDNNGTFGICATTYTPPPAPSNNNPCGAAPVTVNPALTCTSQSNGSVVGATASTVSIGSCFGNPDDDVWYSFVATSTSHNVSLNSVAGSATDLYHSVHPGPCGSIGAALVCSDPNSSSVFGLTIGVTYFIRVYTYTSGTQTTTFSVCVTTPPPTGPCGNAANNDFCSNPASLTQGTGTFSSTTSGTYTGDQPGNLGAEFCGSIENNSWYAFVASATSAAFPITSVSGCTNGWGVQAEVYSVTTNSNNCCTVFTSVSNCFNPGTSTTGTVTATGLTIGQTYILMVDGNAGDVCNFTISGWTAVGILPLELLTFLGHNEGDKNIVQWVTATEKNSDFFRLEKSSNGVDFEKLLDINAAGNSESTKYYNTFDVIPFEGISYYRLKLYDLDGSHEYSNIISVDNSKLTSYITAPRPNPTNGNIEFDVNTRTSERILIELYNNNGLIIHTIKQTIEGGYQSLNLDLSKFDSGIYLLKVTFEGTGKSEIQKVMKN